MTGGGGLWAFGDGVLGVRGPRVKPEDDMREELCGLRCFICWESEIVVSPSGDGVRVYINRTSVLLRDWQFHWNGLLLVVVICDEAF